MKSSLEIPPDDCNQEDSENRPENGFTEGFDVDGLNSAYGRPAATGRIRVRPGDFRVEEKLGFEPAGEGEHIWANIEKTLLNTQDVIGLLARTIHIAARDVGVSGLKDRNAVTRQWFSLPKGADPQGRIAALTRLCRDNPDLELCALSANPGKLKRGSHRANGFEIVVRDLVGPGNDVEERVDRIRSLGVPNYFGPQRFGRNGKNLVTANRLFQNQIKKIDRMARGMALSSARAWLFNQVLSVRLRDFGLDGVRIGDALQLDGSNGFFIHDGSDQWVVDRIADHDLHPTGPLWGAGESPVGPLVFEFESAVVRQWPVFADGLARMGLKQQRRALRVIPSNFEAQFETDDTLRLCFSLPGGSFATSLLRELIVV